MSTPETYSPLECRALWHDSDKSSSVHSERITPKPGDLVLDAQYSLVSTGTELLIAKGKVPPNLHFDMRVPYMSGDFILPVKYGYSLTGIELSSGSAYHVMHPHQDKCCIDPALAFEIPEGIPLKRAALASNLETALTAIWDASLQAGERVLVVGFGLIGSLIARMSRDVPGCTVIIKETNPARKSYAQDMGFEVSAHLETAIEPFDVAFNTSASGPGLQAALDAIGREGRVIELSWYGDSQINLGLGGEFHSLRKRIISSQVGQIPAHMSPRWDNRRRRQAVFSLLADPAFDVHITHEIGLEEAALLFNQWRTSPPEGLGYVIRYTN